jgi:glucose/arabinose dehydrogenase
MAFLGDGTMFFTERNGPVKVRRTKQPDQHRCGTERPGSERQRRVMGIAATEPNLVASLFVCYSATNDNRVVRYDYNLTLSAVVGSAVIVDGITEDGSPFGHQGCRIRVGPDGKLWVGTATRVFLGCHKTSGR